MIQVHVAQVTKEELKELIFPRVRATLSVRHMKWFERSFARTQQTWVGYANGEVACMWGLAPPSVMSDSAYLWLYSTDLVNDYKFMFVRWSQRAIEEMLKLYPTLHGHVHEDNASAKRWIGLLGGKFGQKDGPFTPFTIKRKTLNG